MDVLHYSSLPPDPLVPDVNPSLERALAGRYRLERVLGEGGMATVYLAEDLRHRRPVALKVLRPELAHALGPERFQREIETAARLQHPHILGVHDSGDADGQLWFAMPYVEGESLRGRLDREKQLPLDDALRIAREAADALDYAHRHGVIHRDIKPENILLADGHALVADFGIARALGAATGAAEKLTQTGTSVGTAAYMSPEQAAGESEVGPRSDVYSLAIVLYEMLAGETPFAAATPQAMIARRFTETPRPLRAHRDTVPEPVEQAVARALARTPADRFASARTFADSLTVPTAPTVPAVPTVLSVPAVRKRISPALSMLVLGLVVGAGLLFAWRRSAAGSRSSDVTRLAVLPFENLGDSTVEYFSDGLTDEVRGKLSALSGLQVIARSSSQEYKHTGKTPQEIGRELGVEYLLTGTVRWENQAGQANSRVRVSPELIEVATGATSWQQPFEAALTGVFQVQSDIAGRVAGALDVALGASQRQAIAAKPTENLEAYDAYLQGLAARQLGATPMALREALGHFERAVSLDSTFAAAWAGVSDAGSLLFAQGAPSAALVERSRSAADRALRLAPGSPVGYRALGDFYRRVTGDPRQALEPYRKGIALAPGDATLLVGLSLAEQGIGDWAAALEHMVQSQRIDPRSSATAESLAQLQLWMRRYPDALASYDLALRLQPGSYNAVQGRAMTLAAMGDLAGARTALAEPAAGLDRDPFIASIALYWDTYWLLSDAQQARLRELPPDPFDGDRGGWGLALAGAYETIGDMARARTYADSARAAFEQQLQAAPDDAQRLVLLGVSLAYLGQADEAVRLGRRSVEQQPLSRDYVSGAYYTHQLARIHILLGQEDEALELLELLLAQPYYLSPAWVRLDPTFRPLQGNPRFQRLAAQAPAAH